MKASSDDLARRVASRLSGELDRNLPAAVEAQLQAGGKAPERPATYEPATLIALATLVLNVAKFAWDIYRERKKDAKAAPTPETIARTVRLELKADERIPPEQRDKVIAAVVDELMRAPPAT